MQSVSGNKSAHLTGTGCSLTYMSTAERLCCWQVLTMADPRSIARVYGSPECLRARHLERLRFADVWQATAVGNARDMAANCRTHQRLYVSHSLRAAYLSNPKAAHRTVANIFRNVSMAISDNSTHGAAYYHEVPLIGHDQRASFIKDTLPSDYLLFTFVRDPIGAFLSGYAEAVHRVLTDPDRARRVHGKDTLFDRVSCSRGDTNANATRFAAFLDDLTSCRNIGYDFYHVWPQVTKLDALPANGERSFDFVGRTENLAEDMDELLRRLRVTNTPRSVLQSAVHISSLTNDDPCHKLITVPAAAVDAALPVLCDLLEADFKCFGYVLPSHCGQLASKNEHENSGSHCNATVGQKAALLSIGHGTGMHAASDAAVNSLPERSPHDSAAHPPACQEGHGTVHLESADVCFGLARLGKGEVAAEDQPAYLIDSLPEQLNGAIWFRTPHRVTGLVNITLEFGPEVHTAEVWLYWNSRAGLSAPVAVAQLPSLGFQPVAGSGPRYSRPGLKIPGPSTMWVNRYERAHSRTGKPGVVAIGPQDIRKTRNSDGATFGIAVTGVCRATAVSDAPGCTQTRSFPATAADARRRQASSSDVPSTAVPVTGAAQTPCSFFLDPTEASTVNMNMNMNMNMMASLGVEHAEIIDGAARQAAHFRSLVEPSLWTIFKHYAPAMSLIKSWKTAPQCQNIGLNVTDPFNPLNEGSEHILFSVKWTTSNHSPVLAADVILKCDKKSPTGQQLAERPGDMLVMPCRRSAAAVHRYGVCTQTLFSDTSATWTKRRCGIDERLLPLNSWDVLEEIPAQRVHRVMQSLAEAFLDMRLRGLVFQDGGMHQFCVVQQFNSVRLCDYDRLHAPGGLFAFSNRFGPPEYYPQRFVPAVDPRITRPPLVDGQRPARLSFEGDVFVLGSILTTIRLAQDGIYGSFSRSLNLSSFFCIEHSYCLWSPAHHRKFPTLINHPACGQRKGTYGILNRPCTTVQDAWHNVNGSRGHARGMCVLESAWEEDAQLRHWASQNSRMANLLRLMCKEDPIHRPAIKNVTDLLAAIDGESSGKRLGRAA